MNLRLYILGMGVATAITATSFILALTFINPETTGAIGFVLFFASLCLTSIGIFSLIGVGIRIVLFRSEMELMKVRAALRQAFWCMVIVCACLLLLRQQLLTWWSIGVLVGACALFELIFFARDTHSLQQLPSPNDENVKKN